MFSIWIYGALVLVSPCFGGGCDEILIRAALANKPGFTELSQLVYDLPEAFDLAFRPTEAIQPEEIMIFSPRAILEPIRVFDELFHKEQVYPHMPVHESSFDQCHKTSDGDAFYRGPPEY